MAPALGQTGERAPTYRDKRLREEILAEAKRRGEGCFYCGAEPDTVDHLRPLALGGERYDKANMVPACKPCNSAKGSKTVGHFIGSVWLRERRQEVERMKEVA